VNFASYFTETVKFRLIIDLNFTSMKNMRQSPNRRNCKIYLPMRKPWPIMKVRPKASPEEDSFVGISRETPEVVL